MKHLLRVYPLSLAALVFAHQPAISHLDKDQFRTKLASSIAQAWSTLPYRDVEFLEYKLYASKKGYIAAVRSKGRRDTLYWADHPNERYLYILPSQLVSEKGNSLTIGNEHYYLLESWSNGIPSID